jgi:hypothetical protein
MRRRAWARSIRLALRCKHMSFTKMTPGSSHHGLWNITKLEVVHFLIIFHFISFKHWGSVFRVITELTVRNRSVVILHVTYSKVSSNLIESVVHTEFSIDAKVLTIFWNVSVLILRYECFTPSSWMTPMTLFKVISHAFVNDGAIEWITICLSELSIITCIEVVEHLTDFEISLSHFYFLSLDKSFIVIFDEVAWVLFMGNTFVFNWGVYITFINIIKFYRSKRDVYLPR